MPVGDIPVHEKTKDKGIWGCYNRPDFKPSHVVKKEIIAIPFVGKLLTLIGVYRLERIPFINSMECVTGQLGGEPKCNDCFRRVKKENQ